MRPPSGQKVIQAAIESTVDRIKEVDHTHLEVTRPHAEKVCVNMHNNFVRFVFGGCWFGISSPSSVCSLWSASKLVFQYAALKTWGEPVITQILIFHFPFHMLLFPQLFEEVGTDSLAAAIALLSHVDERKSHSEDYRYTHWRSHAHLQSLLQTILRVSLY